ncbi:ImcF-related family protein [Cronobacter turicensis]|uniref:ImcF-related family protein n=1 Tax=Cronobacter turicensis TaxID=413502 RepID=UPI0024C310BA|nr:ImcF-related family protein [Cronobacter turicensis]MDK1184813.1 ImcF-related family protein [Cronobacter turicensis]MDK1206883.1 ImcF-related family protein [Cronobacter turicensis]MDK1215599.1 ImcF-related family protein [Cronobacter turicensis]MDK1219823.1 ImcF-related family protein [Cronobacter turicensis]MDK1233627.1 ImcF-related family protein [Cronobacter turicensis]
MSKVKKKSLIGATVAALFFLEVLVAFLLYACPQWVARNIGLGPFDGPRILTVCSVLAFFMLLMGWLIDKAFEYAGKSGLYLEWGRNKTQASGNDEEILRGPEDKSGAVFNETPVIEHLRLRYGRFWQHNVRILLVIGKADETEKAAPGLCSVCWQEGDGNVLIYGGDGQSPQDEALLHALKRLRARRPLDGIVHVLDSQKMPTDIERDAFVRCRQQAAQWLGWQAPVWLWLTNNARWPQETREDMATGILFGPDATTDDAMNVLDALTPRLRRAGIAQMLAEPRHDALLHLASRLQGELKSQLNVLIEGLMRGPAAYRLRGVMFSPAAAHHPVIPHTRLNTPNWQAVAEDCVQVRPQKMGLDGVRILSLFLLAFAVCWGAGTLLSLGINRTDIYLAQETSRLAADSTQPLSERLKHQMGLQQTMARLQHREATGAPWYTRFGLNQDHDMLAALWPLYGRNNTQLMRDAAAAQLQQQLEAFVRLPPLSRARVEGTQRAYDVLKGYLMLAQPDNADASWLARTLVNIWPKRQGVPDGLWRELSPKLVAFYAQNLPAHPEWKIKPDVELISTVRQILLKQIGQRNAETGLYQAMLKRIASNWPDLQLADMTGDTDASTLFTTDEVVPGMFTRQAWEEQVQGAIDEVVKSRNDAIDWVLTDKAHQPDADISPEALKARLTERYFTDFGNAWLNMINSIQWIEADSLSDSIAQLNLLADVRQSPLVALMNTLNYQGKTGQQSEALADSLVDSAKKLMGSKKRAKQFLKQAQGPEGPLESVFGPLNGLMEGKDGAGASGNLSFQSWLSRVTQVRLKLQQVTSAPDPQAMAQKLAQTVFEGKAIDLTDTRDYGSLVAASLGQEWSGFGQALFVQPLDLAWRQVLAPAANGLNDRWKTTIVEQWNNAFAGRYPFKSTGSDASLPILAQFLRADSGRIATFLKNNLGGILHQEGNRWVVDPSASQGMTVNPAFLTAINQLAAIADTVFAQGDASARFELMARPSRDVARVQLTLDGQKLDYFNQMESWRSFVWPGETWYPGVDLSWRTVTSGMQLYSNQSGKWGFIRLLSKAQITPIDSSRIQLVWLTPDGSPLKFIMRTEMGDGPLALLKLQDFHLPETIFNTEELTPVENALEQGAE